MISFVSILFNDCHEDVLGLPAIAIALSAKLLQNEYHIYAVKGIKCYFRLIFCYSAILFCLYSLPSIQDQVKFEQLVQK